MDNEFPISVEIEGKTYTGSREIESRSPLRQRVRYGRISKIDAKLYKSGDGILMEANAHNLLYELIEEHKKTFGTMQA